MFERLKRVFTNAAKSISQRELSEKDLEESLFDLQVGLLESDVSQEVIDDLSLKIKNNLVGMKLQKNETAEQMITSTLKNNFMEIMSKAGSIDLLGRIQEKKQNKSGPFIIVFLGINGTGKTTTVAKVANLLKKTGFSVVIAAADTHRAGAIEQISTHAENLSIKIISQRYGADPTAVSRDALEYAKKHYIDVVLIDTAGRMQTAKNLMYEIGKIVKVMKPDLKLFVGDSLAGNDTIHQAREFFSFTEFDGAILTKSDADAKGGAAISISYITSKPILYLGMGQGYDDLVLFNKMKFVNAVFGTDSMSEYDSSYEPPVISETSKLSSIKTESLHKYDSNSDTDENNLPLIKVDDLSTSEKEIIPETSSSLIPVTVLEEEKESDTTFDSINTNMVNSIDEKIHTIENSTENSDKENIKNDVENKSDSRGKKGLFGWFKKKK